MARKKAPKAQAQPSTTTSADGRIRRDATDGLGQPFAYSFRRLTVREANALLKDDTQFISAEFVDAVALQIDGFSDPLDASADRVTAAGVDIVDFTLMAGNLEQMIARARMRPAS